MLVLILSFLFASAHGAPLSQGTFQVHVRPQLVGIYQDFRQILGTFNGYPDEVLTLMTSVDRLQAKARVVSQLCPLRTALSCGPQLEELLGDLRDLERLFLRFQSSVRFDASSGLSPIAGQRLWLMLDRSRTRLRNLLEVEVVCLSSGKASEHVPSALIRKLVGEMESYMDLIVVEFVPPKLQDDFRSAWMNFFRPVHRYGEIEGRAAFIGSNLEQLNVYWNILNLRMTKRLKQTPEGMSGPLNAIQNRWNQVMRISNGQ